MESLKIIVMLAVGVLSQSVGNVLLSKGMKELAGSRSGAAQSVGADALGGDCQPDGADRDRVIHRVFRPLGRRAVPGRFELRAARGLL